MNLEQTNAIIRVDVARLNWPTATLHARRYQSFRARIVGVPADVTALTLRVFKPAGGFYDLPANAHSDGSTWTVYAVGTCFPEVGEAAYEVRATDAKDHPTALGRGSVVIGDFSDNTAAADGQAGEFTIDTIVDATGASHTIKAVKDDSGEWTTIVD